MRAHAHPDTAAVDEEPSVTIGADRTREEIAIVGPGAAHHIGVEPPTLLGVHRGIDPQRARSAVIAHASTLSRPTDTDSPRRARAQPLGHLLGRHGLRRVAFRTART